MASDPSLNAALEPGFFDGRRLIQIDRWDGELHVGLSREGVPTEHRFQGGLMYVRGFVLEGRVLAPGTDRFKAARIWLSPFGPDLRFGPDELDEVGQLHFHAPKHHGFDLSGTLLVPAEALAAAGVCLASVWKYLHVWAFDEDSERASVRSFSFSSSIPKNLERWVAD